MQRHLYPALLLTSIILTAAVFLRPTLGKEVLLLAQSYGVPGSAYSGSAAWPAAPTPSLGGGYPSRTQRVLADGSGTGVAAGEAYASDSADSAQPGGSPYRTAAPYPYRPPVQQPQGSLGLAPTSGPSYPVAGSGGQRVQSDQFLAPSYPIAGSRATPPEPVGRYPAAGSARSHFDPGPSLPYPGRWEPEEERAARAGEAFQPQRGPPAPFADRPSSPSHLSRPFPHEAEMNVESPVVAEVRPCEGAQILARVGSHLILAGEVTPAVDRWLAQIEGQIPPEELETARKMATVKMLEDLIERKLVYQDAQRRIPAEGLQNLEKRLAEHFEEEILPKRIEEAGVKSRRELEEKLHSAGTSLDQQKRLFVEQGVKEVWQRDQKESESDISHDEMLEYYHEHVGEFTTPARARWEELWVRIPRYTDGREAQDKLAYLGNQLMQGVPMDEAVQSQPKGTPECRRRSRGWINRDGGELSDVLDQAVFGLPVGRLSRILEDTDGFHIVRVLERQEAECTPFEDAQVKIREEIRQRRSDEREQEYLAELRHQIPVWTVFDDDPQAAQLLRESATMRR